MLLIPNKHRRSQEDQRGRGSPKFIAHVVVLCFERQCPKPNTVARLNSKYLAPQKFRAGYAINVGASTFLGVQGVSSEYPQTCPKTCSGTCAFKIFPTKIVKAFFWCDLQKRYSFVFLQAFSVIFALIFRVLT